MTPLLKIVFTEDTANPPFVNGDEIKVYYDSGSFLLYITSVVNGWTDLALTDSSYFVTLGYPIGQDSQFNPVQYYVLFSLDGAGNTTPIGPGHFGGRGGIPLSKALQYQFCDSSTLHQFKFDFAYPWVTNQLLTNHPSCTPDTVCDITLGQETVVKPTTASSLDGSITIAASSSFTDVRYSLTDQRHVEMTNTTGIFTGLGVGNYTVYSRDDFGCRATKSITITEPTVISVNYGTIYRQEWKDYRGRSSRVDIQKRDYTGIINNIKGAGNPFELRLRGENGDFFDTILASEATQNLFSETNQYFLSLFTDDDRKYQVIFYKDTGSGLTEYWRGFGMAGLYQEQHAEAHNYYVAHQSTDQLTTLKDAPFTDAAGNVIRGKLSLVQILSIILLKTDLNLSYRVAVNIFDSAMSTGATDDPFNQTYIKAESYEGMSCWEVLDNVLASFGANIIQWGQYWHIRRRGEITGTYAYRQYSSYGVYVTNGTSNKVINSASDWGWQDRSQNLEVIPPIGSINIIHELKKGFYFRNGGFEEGIVGGEIPGFTLYLNGNAASSSIVPGKDSLSAVKVISSSDNPNYGEDAYLLGEAKPVLLSTGDSIRFSIDYFPTNKQETKIAKFSKFKISLLLDTFYLQSDGGWDSVNQWIEVLVEDSNFNKWNNFSLTVPIPLGATANTTVQCRIMTGGTLNDRPDVHSLVTGFAAAPWFVLGYVALRAYPTTTLELGAVRWELDTNLVVTTIVRATSVLNYYRLRAGTDADSPPNILRPTDYAGGTNEKVWELIAEVDGIKDYTLSPGYQPYGAIVDESSGFVNIFDNVNFDVLPGGQETPTTKPYTKSNNVRNKKIYERTLVNGDAPINVVNGLYSYINVYTLADGTATRIWKRPAVTEGQPLLSILTKQIEEQSYIPKFKLTGMMHDNGTYFGFDACLKEYGKFYAPAGMTLRDKQCECQMEMLQITEEQSHGVTSPFSSGFSSGAFGNSFNI